MVDTNKPRILYFDLETTPLQAWVWRMGDQTVRHGQLVTGRDSYDVICVTYCWNDGKPAKAMDWGFEEQNSKQMLADFDKLIIEADVVIGKNSDRFDNKHLNFHRMMNGQSGMPDWTKYTDDLEKQMRKHFGQALPSQSLDYISKILGLGGKIKMEMSDWINIVEKTEEENLGKKALAKMVKYGKKDVEDTRTIWEYVEAHITPKYNRSVNSEHGSCATCGSYDLIKNGIRRQGQIIYQTYRCNSHNGYAGRKTIKQTNPQNNLSV